MKKIIIKFPVAKANEISDIIGQHGFVVLVCWSETGGLFDSSIKMHLAIPADKEDTAIAKFQGFIQKS